MGRVLNWSEGLADRLNVWLERVELRTTLGAEPKPLDGGSGLSC